MKTLLLLAFLFSITFHAHAQVDRERMFQFAKVEKYRRMKNTGTALTLTGGVLFVVGVVTLSNVEYTTTGYGYGSTTTATSGNPGFGVAALLLGCGGLGAGVPLWIVGSHAQKKWQRKLDGLSVRLKVDGDGAGLAFKF